MDDPFDILGLEPRFDLDPATLQRVYLRELARLHPDRYRDPMARAQAEGEAARVNEARDTLADDERRAGALLERLGGPSAAENKSLPDGFLLEIMSLREEMAEALASGDETERRRFETWADAARRARIATIRDRFVQALREDAREPDTLRAIRIELNALRYVERMIEQLDPDHAPLL